MNIPEYTSNKWDTVESLTIDAFQIIHVASGEVYIPIRINQNMAEIQSADGYLTMSMPTEYLYKEYRPSIVSFVQTKDLIQKIKCTCGAEKAKSLCVNWCDTKGSRT